MTSPVSVRPPAGWDRFVGSAQGAPRLTAPEAGAVLDGFLDNIRLEACDWQPDVVAAAMGERPAVIPAWGYGFRGAGSSYHVRTPGLFPPLRRDDAVQLTWVTEGEHPDNPFEHTAGQGYRPDEELGVHLEAGDWLEFEASDVADLGRYEPVLLDGGEVTLEPSARGMRAVARTEATLLRIVRRDDAMSRDAVE